MTTENTEIPFSVGDLVRHRASGEKAVVTDVGMKCVNPDHFTDGFLRMHLMYPKTPCNRVPTGAITVSASLTGEEVEIDSILVEKCEVGE